jgi:hypothetical protein
LDLQRFADRFLKSALALQCLSAFWGAGVCWLWASQLFGKAAGLLALTLWCFCPLVLRHAGAVPDLVQTRKVPRVLDLLAEELRRTWSELSGPPCQQLTLANEELLMDLHRAYLSHLEAPLGEPGQTVTDQFHKTLRPER